MSRYIMDLISLSPKELLALLEKYEEIAPMYIGYVSAELVRRQIKFGPDNWQKMKNGRDIPPLESAE